MRILFCNDDLDNRSVDPHFVKENEAALVSGFAVSLIDFNAVQRRDEDDALRRLVASPHPERAIDRGWMLTPDEYEFLNSAMDRRNIVLVTTPEEYVHCHWLPNSYPTISAITPRTVWIPTPECFDMATAKLPVCPSDVM